jgi:multicomponent Na+:H+ antiporter subunit E
MSSILAAITPRRVVVVVALSATWCILWRDVSVANILAGAAIGIATMAAGVGTGNRGGIRPVPLLRFFWLVLVDLTKSTVSVGLDTITPHDRTEESIIAVDLPPGGRHHHLLLIVSITLTPGTAIVDADPDTGVVYIHVLYGHWRDDTAAHVRKLAQVAAEALPATRTEAAL